MLFKITLKQEIHLLKSKQGHKFDNLVAYILTAFKNLPARYHLTYIDQDGDQINLDNQHDYQSLMQTGLSKVNLKIVELGQQSNIIDRKSSVNSERIQSVESAEDKFSRKQSNEIQKIQFLKEETKTNTQIEAPKQTIPEDLFIQDQQKTQKYTSHSQKTEQPMKPQEPIKVFLQSPEQIVNQKEPRKNRIFKLKKNQEQKKQKLQKIVIPDQSEHADPKHNFIHDEVTCDFCGTEPIIGNRYKCTVCFNYDICEDCQKSFEHEHAFIKIKYRDQQFQRQSGSVALAVGNSIVKYAGLIKNGINSVLENKQVKQVKQNKQKNRRARSKQSPRSANIESALQKLKPVEVKLQVPVPAVQLTEQDKRISSAKYLNDILGLDFNRCYTFVLKHPNLTNQELIVQYFQNVKAI